MIKEEEASGKLTFHQAVVLLKSPSNCPHTQKSGVREIYTEKRAPFEKCHPSASPKALIN